MIKVADSHGVVLSYHSYHPQWWSDNLISPYKCDPVFKKNQPKVLRVESVLQSTGQAPPAHLDTEVKPPAAGELMEGDESSDFPPIRVTVDGKDMEDDEFDILDAVEGSIRSSIKRSRRIKPKTGKNPGKK
jgi:hypothetical protein